MSLIAALCDPLALRDLRRSLPESDELELCTSSDELLFVMRNRRIDAVVTEPRERSGELVVRTVRYLRSRHASLPIVAWCPLTPGVSVDLFELMHAGISAVVFRGVDDVARALRAALGVGELRSVRSVVSSAAMAVTESEHGRAFIAYCVDRSCGAPTVEEMAFDMGVHRKTLVNWMHGARLPPPQQTLGWCRLLLAAKLLADELRSVESVAFDLGFGSATELRNMLRRYTQLRPGEIRGAQGFERMLALFMRESERCARAVPNPPSGDTDRDAPIARRETVLAH